MASPVVVGSDELDAVALCIAQKLKEEKRTIKRLLTLKNFIKLL
jgi:hypothetical protein